MNLFLARSTRWKKLHQKGVLKTDSGAPRFARRARGGGKKLDQKRRTFFPLAPLARKSFTKKES